MESNRQIAVVIPCYKVRKHILPLLKLIGPEVAKIYIVDDCCPERTGMYVKEHCLDKRVDVIFHSLNQGVGGAVVSGYRAALDDGQTVVVKLDGDGQMDPALIERFAWPILSGIADYTKGNRFYELDSLCAMPYVRIFGNSVLSFINKLSSGYWSVMDPTNGYTAIHARLLKVLPLEKLDKRYFFESDLLFRLGTVRAAVIDIPMIAVYGDEVSNLRISNTIVNFPSKYLARFFKRIAYIYFLRDFNAASIQLVAGFGLLVFGMVYGAWHWFHSVAAGVNTSAGVIMLAALPVILGVQFLISALGYDVSNAPRHAVHPLIR